MARKKKSRKQSFGDAIGLQNKIFNNDKIDFILGLLLLLMAVVVTIAMVSFLSTGKADQSILENIHPADWVNQQREFQNIGGSIGAILSYQLISVNFGLPAFLIPLFIIIVGLKMMKIYSINLWKWFFCMMLVMVWSSVTFAKFLSPILSDQIYNPGGNHGLYCVQNLENVVGTPGLTALLLFIAIAFLTYLSAETITVIRKALNPVKYLTSHIKFSVTDTTNKAESEENIEEETEEEEEEESTELDPLPQEDVPSPVVDLTDYSQGAVQPKPVVPPVAVEKPLEVTAAAGEATGGMLTVDVAKDEDKATSKTLSPEQILSTPIDPREPYTRYKFPSLSLLKRYDSNKPVVDYEEIKANNNRIVEVLHSFGVEISKINATVGPTITLYEITPAEGVRINKIRNLEDDIALSLSALGIRIIAPMPGKGTIGIEVPNKNPQIVSMESVLNSKRFQETKMALPVAVGKTISNEVYMFDLHKLPHLLVAGATGQGKSVGLNAIITSLLYKKHPNELKFVLVDPKKVEFSIYNKIAPHYMACLPENDEEPIITDVQKVVRTLNSLCKLMDHRYDLLKMAQVKKIEEYNDKFIHHRLDLTKGHEYMPYIVVIIDEFGDLIMTAGKEIELPIARIAQLARAVGIHMVIATQRPTTKIITGNIKANFPGRIAFRVTSVIDSRTILDRKGADQLIGKGDMLFLAGGDPVRIQCAFIDTPEIESVNDHIADQPGPVEPAALPEPADENAGDGGFGGGGADLRQLDPYFNEAAHAIVLSQQGSTSMIQRRFSIGYNRAGRLMDQLEQAGIVGAAMGSKPRDVLVQDENSLNEILARLNAN